MCPYILAPAGGLHCLIDQWCAFGPPHWASGPILHAPVCQNDLGRPSRTNSERLVKIQFHFVEIWWGWGTETVEKNYSLSPGGKNMQHMIKIHYIINLCHDEAKLFYFMHFFLHCLFWPPGVKTWYFDYFWTHHGHFGRLLLIIILIKVFFQR